MAWGKIKTRVPKKARNWHAVNAKSRSSAGPMRDAKKQRSKVRCRGPVKSDD